MKQAHQDFLAKMDILARKVVPVPKDLRALQDFLEREDHLDYLEVLDNLVSKEFL